MINSFYRQLKSYVDQCQLNRSRREFLGRVGMGTVLLSATSINSPAVASKISRMPRVIVVGAGFAGLSCAYELQNAGCDMTVIEASDRVGGRVLSSTTFVPGRVTEFGAELIGANHPTWMHYAKSFNLELTSLTENPDWHSPIRLNGSVLSPTQAQTLLNEVDEAFMQLDAAASSVFVQEPWKTPDAVKLDNQTVAHWIEQLACSDLCKSAMTLVLEADNGQDTSKQSYLGLLTVIQGHGGAESFLNDTETYRCKGGNQTLAFLLSENIRKLHLNLPITKVVWTDTGVSATCADGQTFFGDDIVIAVAPSVWSKIDFEPPLPPWLIPQMGLNTKWFAHLQSRFWQKNGQEQYALSEGIFNMTWDGSDGQPGDDNPVFVCFNGARDAARAGETFAQGGPSALQAAYLNELEILYPGFTENLALADNKTFFMDWPNDPWVMGGYSFPAPGQITTQGLTLQEGLGKRLHFAGEHTCYGFTGFMEGALYSGVEKAKRIAAARQSMGR